LTHIPKLTPELLAGLGRELGDCDFSDESHVRFLGARGSCDVQAAPGNGKTTLLVAKLALLSRSWHRRDAGVCVISYTNAAREEIQKRLGRHPSAAAFLAYPHFVGTVTGFIHQYLTFPYLRGLGWKVRRIDDVVAGLRACEAYATKPVLSYTARRDGGRRKHTVEGWVSGLELAPDMDLPTGERPRRLRVRRPPYQPGPDTKTGRELEEIKAQMVGAGLYRFGDMTVLANKALDACPHLSERIRARFPLVLLDEAQDTSGAELALLDRLFGQGVAYQRLGDSNQTLYEDSEVAPADRWQPNRDALPLDRSRRFGAEIADFASRLTIRRPQVIMGREGMRCRRTLLLFDRATIGKVLPTYAQEVRAHWGDALTDRHAIWAVASRHSPTTDRSGGWLKTLGQYCPEYLGPARPKAAGEAICAAFREASRLFDARAPMETVMELAVAGLVDFLSLHGFVGPDGDRVSHGAVWRALAATDKDLPLVIRRMLLRGVVRGGALRQAEAWEGFCADLRRAIGLDEPTRAEASRRLAFLRDGPKGDPSSAAGSGTCVRHDGVTIGLGSIHSLKGRSVDAILVLESEVHRGRRLDERAMDLEEVLPHALGVERRNLAASHAKLTAATNVFVAVTRPRELLALAVRSEVVDDRLRDAAREQGWIVRDLTT
jgi:hypothetical protein